jgi:hypothetical protein
MIIVLLATLTVAMLICALCSVNIMRGQGIIQRQIAVQLKGLGETHLLGFEALATQLNKLEARAAEFDARLAAIEARDARHANVIRLDKPL